MDKDKKDFLNNEILSSSIFAGLARGRVYAQNIKGNKKTKFKNTLKHKLKEYVSEYQTKIGDDKHVKNIIQFADEMSDEFDDILINKRFRIGTAQKVLNLYLKYLWILGWIPEPPHCPFDSIIITELGLDIRYTKLDSEKDYKRLVEVATQKAKDVKLSIAQWELKIFNQERP